MKRLALIALFAVSAAISAARAVAGPGIGASQRAAEARARVRRDLADAARGMGRARHGQRHRGRRTGNRGEGACRGEGHRPARRDADARPHRRALPHLPAPVQRGHLERPGDEGDARLPHRRRRHLLQGHAAGRLHVAARPWHRGRRVRRRVGAEGHQRGPHSRPAPPGRDQGHRRLGELRPRAPRLRDELRRCRAARRKSAASTRCCGRCAIRSATAPTGSSSTPTIAGARTVPMSPRSISPRCRRPSRSRRAPDGRWPCTRPTPRACAAPSSRAPRPSSMATAAPTRRSR